MFKVSPDELGRKFQEEALPHRKKARRQLLDLQGRDRHRRVLLKEVLH